MITRRTAIVALAGAPLLGCMALPGSARGAKAFRITLTGQVLMTHALCDSPYEGFDAVVAELARGDVVFSDLEVAIKTADSGEPTRDTGFLHTTSADTLACLQQMGFDMFALSNNHAWDLGTAGVLATREAVREHGFIAAGTGPDLEAASAPAFFARDDFSVGLVAMATGKIRDGAAATRTRAGVNELRLEDGEPHAVDAARILATVRQAREKADIVIAYHHNHDWGDDMRLTRPWAQRWAKRCSDAGADLYVSHGAPLLHGVETYHSSLHLFGLGSLVFHSRTAIGHYPPEVWESTIAHCDFVGGQLGRVEFVPVVLNEVGDDPERQNATRGRPHIATGSDADRILLRLARLTADLGVSLAIENGVARLVMPAAF
jgi:poly-gamma-glutamate synthesis protein (capsule biosynthesis protein)